MDLVEIAPGVHACLQPDRGLGWSNSGLVAHGGGLVVDTFWDLPRTRAAMDRYAEHLDGPPERLVNTHHNGDHCYGNQLYAEVGTEIIGHRRCAELLGSDVGPARLASLATADPATLPPHLRGFAEALRAFDFDGIEPTPPTTLVDDAMTIDLGDAVAEITYLGPAHTAGDVIVHLPEHGVVFAGDLLFNQCTPIGWEGTTDRWCEALEAIAALDPEVVVPGHGPLATTVDVLAQRDYLAWVLEEARAHHAAGHSPLEAARAMDLGPFADWNEPERLAFNVHRAYREIQGGAWDEVVDLGAVLADVAALAAHLAGRATT